MRRLVPLLVLLVAGGCPRGVEAHDSGYAYLRLHMEADRVVGELEISLGDARILLDLPVQPSSEAAWAEVLSREARLARALSSGIAVLSDGTECPADPARRALTRLGERDYVRLAFVARCPEPVESLSVVYSLLFQQDPEHRAFLAVSDWTGTRPAVFATDHRRVDLQIRPDTLMYHFTSYLQEGLHHIATGLDHLLFLIALLLPASLVRRGRAWAPRGQARGVLVEVLKVVTAFTFAHSLTLGLAAFDWIALPSRWVEAAIAVSVLIAALNNLQPFLRATPWRLAFGFGLVHGLGFATLLGILGLPLGARGVALLAFNLGVELGQLSIVGICLPPLLALRGSHYYRLVMLEIPSGLIAWIAAVWLLERLTGTSLLTLG